MKLYNILNKENYENQIANLDLKIYAMEIGNSIEIAIDLYDEIIAIITPSELSYYIENNDEEYYEFASYVDEDLCSHIDERFFLKTDERDSDYARLVVEFYIENTYVNKEV